MNGQKLAPIKIDQLLTSDPISVGARTLQLVAHMTGWQIERGTDFQGAGVRLTPHEIRIQEGDRQWTVPITSSAPDPLRIIVGLALLVSGLCWIVLFIVRLGLHREGSRK
jgi:hypothetical protein